MARQQTASLKTFLGNFFNRGITAISIKNKQNKTKQKNN